MKLNLEDYSDGEILKIIREWSNLTQEQLAEKICKNKRTIYDYESGLYTFNMTVLRKIVKELNLEVIIKKK